MAINIGAIFNIHISYFIFLVGKDLIQLKREDQTRSHIDHLGEDVLNCSFDQVWLGSHIILDNFQVCLLIKKEGAFFSQCDDGIHL